MYKNRKTYCDICGIETKYNGKVMWHELEYDLCKSHYLTYCRYKPRLELKKKYKNAKPCTKQWSKMCKEQERIFIKWFKEQNTQKSTTTSKKKSGHNYRKKKDSHSITKR